MERLVLGSRGSALALAQVALVQTALRAAAPALELDVKIITTTGDRRPEARVGELTGSGLKGMFTKEIQEALLSGEIDVAIHSLKDLPGQTPPELEVIAVLSRADTSDLLITRSAATLHTLPAGARIGTSSVRRRYHVLWQRPDLEIEELRGNVPTRLKKLADSSSLDAIILARAGLERLGYTPAAGTLVTGAAALHASSLEMLPAIGQGAIGLEARAADQRVRQILAQIDHAPTHACIRAERELLRLLDGDCHLPVGASITLSGETLSGSAIIFHPDSRPPSQAEAAGDAAAPEELALRLFRKLTA